MNPAWRGDAPVLALLLLLACSACATNGASRETVTLRVAYVVNPGLPA